MAIETGSLGATRPGRCATHPGAQQVGSCEVCGRSLCINCAVPVRGSLLGSECLASVLEDSPPPHRVDSRESPLGSWLAAAGFGLVLLLSVLPWSRYGNSSGIFGAWRPHWSLVAVLAAVGGVLTALWLRRLVDRSVEIAMYAGFALLVAIGAMLHAAHPPLLSKAALPPWLSLIGAALALAGAYAKARGMRRPSWRTGSLGLPRGSDVGGHGSRP